MISIRLLYTSVATPICVRYEGSDLLKINEYTGPCDTLPICNPLNTEDLSLANDISIFPNPTTGKLHWSTGASGVSLMNIRNNVGQLITEFEKGVDFINIKNAPAGIYFLSFEIEGKVVVKKVIRM